MSMSARLPFLARGLRVTASSDASLVGLSGTVVGESRRMITLDVGGETKQLAKNVIAFTLDDEVEVIQGAEVVARPENRIHRKNRRN